MNNPPTGTVTIIGTAQVGETLIASSDIQDLDGIVPPLDMDGIGDMEIMPLHTVLPIRSVHLILVR